MLARYAFREIESTSNSPLAVGPLRKNASYNKNSSFFLYKLIITSPTPTRFRHHCDSVANSDARASETAIWFALKRRKKNAIATITKNTGSIDRKITATNMYLDRSREIKLNKNETRVRAICAPFSRFASFICLWAAFFILNVNI